MIHHVDECLRALLRPGAPAVERPEVSFDAPTPAWAAEVTTPVLNVFLYDVKEHLDARAADWEDVRDDAGRVVGRRPPTRHYVLSYMVSAWAKTADEEHRMLGQVLAAVPYQETIPAEIATGVFAEDDLRLLIRVAVPGAGAGASGWELWSSLGHPPRASLELVVVAPLVAPIDRDVAPPAERIGLSLSREDQAGAAGARSAPSGVPADAGAPPATSGPEPPAGRRRKATPAAGSGEAAAPGDTGTDGRPEPERPARNRWTGVRISEHGPSSGVPKR